MRNMRNLSGENVNMICKLEKGMEWAMLMGSTEKPETVT